jgi:hypothetical protein
VANREGEGWILVNGERRQGTFDLLPPSPNRERLSRIIAAFHQLLRDEAQEARSRNQLMASVIREIRALETEDFIYKEVEFSADGSSLRVLFKSRTGREELRVMDLATVNFFRARKSGAIQPPSYQVMVETRGRQGTIQVNGRREQGTFPLLPLTTNKHKAEKLASMLETLAGYARP